MVDKSSILQIFGSLMKHPQYLSESDKYNLTPDDFYYRLDKFVFIAIDSLYRNGATRIHPIDVENYLSTNDTAKIMFKNQNGIEYLQDAESLSDEENFSYYYKRLKKFNLLDMLKSKGYDTSEFYVEDALTPEALKWKVDSMPQPKEDIDEDMKQPEFDLANYPEFSISCLESWPEIENPFIKKQESSTPKQNTTDNDTYTKKENQSNTVTETREPEGEDIERIEKSQYKAYIKAQDKFSSEYAILKAYSRSAVKARNIQIKNVDGIATAVAEVIIETDDVTNAGRVYYGIINGVRSKENVSLTYFIDKGWVIKNEMSSSEFPEYSDEIDV